MLWTLVRIPFAIVLKVHIKEGGGGGWEANINSISMSNSNNIRASELLKHHQNPTSYHCSLHLQLTLNFYVHCKAAKHGQSSMFHLKQVYYTKPPTQLNFDTKPKLDVPAAIQER